MKKWLSPGLRQEKYKIKLNFFVPESTETLKNDGEEISEGHPNQFKGAPIGITQECLNIKIIILTYCNPLSKTEGH